jgi:hypothetical protein
MSEPMTAEIADALAAVNAATHKRGYDKGLAAASAIAQRDLMLANAAKAAEQEKPGPAAPTGPSQIILVDEGGIERILENMENPDA